MRGGRFRMRVPIGPPMPFACYRGLADAGMRSLISCLRMLRPVPSE